MAETLVENQICNACGVDARDGALFCYNCGKSVAPQTTVEEADKKNKAGDARLRKKTAKNRSKENAELKETLTLERISDVSIPKPEIQVEDKTDLATAQRKSATFQKKTVEVIWEEHENAPNGLFIAVALILALFAAGVLLLAMYLG